jgi:hypothetical protein
MVSHLNLQEISQQPMLFEIVGVLVQQSQDKLLIKAFQIQLWSPCNLIKFSSSSNSGKILYSHNNHKERKDLG